jgi:hypothetical protein
MRDGHMMLGAQGRLPIAANTIGLIAGANMRRETEQ